MSLLQGSDSAHSATTLFLSSKRLFVLLIDFYKVSCSFEALSKRAEEAFEAVRKQAEEALEVARKQDYYQRAIHAYQFALLHNPSDEDAFRGMGHALYALKRYSEANSAFTVAITLKPSPAAYAGLGDVLAKQEQYSQAIGAYQKAITLDSTVTLNYDNFILSLQKLGQDEQAKRIRILAMQLGYFYEE